MASDEKHSLKTQLAVYASGVFSFTSQHITGVVVPLLVLTLHVSPLVVGIILAARQVLPIFLSIPGGVLMDRLGPKKVMLYAASIAIFTPLLFPALPYAIPLILLQLVNGYITNVGWVGSQTLIGQMSRGSTKFASWFTFTLRAGILAGPALGGFCWDRFGPWGGFAVMALWGAGFLIATLNLPDTPGEAGPDATMRLADLKPKLSDYSEAFRLLVSPAVMFVMIISTWRIASQAIEGTFYAVYLSGVGYSGTEIGLLFSVSAAVGFAGSVSVNILSRLFKQHWLLVWMSGLATVGILVTPFFGSSYVLLMAAMMLRGFCLGVSQPLLISLTSRNVEPAAQGTAVGLRNTMNRMAQVSLPILMGAVGEWIGIADSFPIMGGMLIVLMMASSFTAWRKDAFRKEG
jgi:predicted MFS family arabinose efflux permease